MKADETLTKWMARNHIRPEALLSRAWRAFQLIVLMEIVMTFLTVLAFGLVSLLYLGVVLVLLPFLISTIVANRPIIQMAKEQRSLLREAPVVIGSIAMSMSLAPSLEKAVAFSSTVNSNTLGRMLSQTNWLVLTRAQADLQSSLLDLAASLSEINEGLREALHLIMASVYEPTREGTERLLEKANALVIDGLGLAADKYVASLTAPTLVLFSLGILLPVMLFSVVPLMELSSSMAPATDMGFTAGASMPILPLTVLLVVIIPICSLFYAHAVLQSNPLGGVTPPGWSWDWKTNLFLMAWGAGIVALLALDPIGSNPYGILLWFSVPLGFFLTLRLKEKHNEGKRNRSIERGFITALFQIGNRMLAGASLQKAMKEAADSSGGTDFSLWSERMIYSSRTSRKSLDESIAQDKVCRPRHALIAETYDTLAKCSKRDPQSAGRLAVGLAKNLNSINSQESRIEEKLKGVVDMMRSTSLLFAPIVLGITCSLFGITGMIETEATSAVNAMTLVTGIYVLELAFVVSFFTNFLLGNKEWGEVAYAFGCRAPVAMAIFTSVSLFAHAGFSRLL